jgi:hypothetical protein
MTCGNFKLHKDLALSVRGITSFVILGGKAAMIATGKTAQTRERS